MQLHGELALFAEARAILIQVDKLYWDGEVVQKTRKKDHQSKAQQLWKVTAFQLGQQLCLYHGALQLHESWLFMVFSAWPSKHTLLYLSALAH